MIAALLASALVAAAAGPPEVHLRSGEDFAAALLQVPEGGTLRIEPGRHAGPWVLDRSVAVRGSPGAIVDGGGFGTVVRIDADGASLADLRVTASGGNQVRGDAGVLIAADRVTVTRVHVDDTLIGIELRQTTGSAVRDCQVTGRKSLPMGLRGDGLRVWESKDNELSGNILDGVRDLVVWYSSGNQIIGNEVRECRYGTHFMHSDQALVRGNSFLGCVVGVFTMYSTGVTMEDNRVEGASGAAGVGLGFKDSDDVVARRNELVGNTTGVYLDHTPSRIGGRAVFEGNLIAFDGTGLRIHGSQDGARFIGNDFHENAVTITVDGGSKADGTVFSGNHFTDYAGYDLDGDGGGDVPWEYRRFSATLRVRRPAMAFFSDTPALFVLDLLARILPTLAPATIARDEQPAMASPFLAEDGRRPGRGEGRPEYRPLPAAPAGSDTMAPLPTHPEAP